jgi:hypothetical protein
LKAGLIGLVLASCSQKKKDMKEETYRDIYVMSSFSLNRGGTIGELTLSFFDEWGMTGDGIDSNFIYTSFGHYGSPAYSRLYSMHKEENENLSTKEFRDEILPKINRDRIVECNTRLAHYLQDIPVDDKFLYRVHITVATKPPYREWGEYSLHLHPIHQEEGFIKTCHLSSQIAEALKQQHRNPFPHICITRRISSATNDDTKKFAKAVGVETLSDDFEIKSPFSPWANYILLPRMEISQARLGEWIENFQDSSIIEGEKMVTINRIIYRMSVQDYEKLKLPEKIDLKKN